jgi:hypothetical protein
VMSEGVGGSVGADLAAIEASLASYEGQTYADLQQEISDDFMGETGDLIREHARAVLTQRSLLALVGQLQGQLDRVWALITNADTYTGEYIHVDMLRSALAAAVLSDREGTRVTDDVLAPVVLERVIGHDRYIVRCPVARCCPQSVYPDPMHMTLRFSCFNSTCPLAAVAGTTEER